MSFLSISVRSSLYPFQSRALHSNSVYLPASIRSVFLGFQSRTIREFDASFVVKQFGFRDVEDYYNAASLNDKLHRIQVPLLGLNAADDPFIPFSGE